MDLDAVFGKSKVWYDGLPPEAQAEIDKVAVRVKELGREPSWAAVMREFKKEFPGLEPATDTTLRATIRRRREAL